MRNLHQILLEDGIEAWHLFRIWEKLRLRASEYKNHRIFTLRCLHNDLIPVSIKLKSTLKSARANKILRKAEKELLQTRVKSINYILDNTSKQLDECRSQLASIISTQRLKECQDFIAKVGENRFNKVKQRQLNKFNLLTIRKEGNITRSNNTNTKNLTSQAGNQFNPTNSQANPPTREGSTPSQVNTPSQASTPSPGEASTSPATATTPGEGNIPSQASTPPPRDASASPATTVTTREGSTPSQATATLPGEGSLPSQARSLPLGEASASPAIAILLGEGSNSSQAVSLPPPREGNSSSHSLRSTQVGQGSNPTRSARQGSRHPPVIGLPRPPRRAIPPPRKATLPLPPIVGLPKVLPMKNLTLSGSSTYQTSL